MKDLILREDPYIAQYKPRKIVKIDATSNQIQVIPFGNDTIQGLGLLALSSQWGKAILTADGVATWVNEGMNEV